MCVCVCICALSSFFHQQRAFRAQKGNEKETRKDKESAPAASWGCKAVTVSQHTSVHPGKEIHAFDLDVFQDSMFNKTAPNWVKMSQWELRAGAADCLKQLTWR